VSGDLDAVIDWLRGMSELNAACPCYEAVLPPEAREEHEEDDLWAGELAEMLDDPGINFGARVCDDPEDWAIGLPG
jgi:hypothetical protein